MSRKIEEIKLLREYLNGINARSLHHAQAVNEVIFPLIGIILLKSEGDILVRDQDGLLKNVIWFTINTTKYSMKYDHELSAITLHSGSSTGIKLYEFRNSDSIKVLIEIFNNL